MFERLLRRVFDEDRLEAGVGLMVVVLGVGGLFVLASTVLVYFAAARLESLVGLN